MGLKVRDLALKELVHDPKWEQRQKDKERLKLLERQHGLAIMAQAVIPNERNYWAAVERNVAIKGRALWRKLYPEQAARIDRQRESRRIIREYGVDELWNCLPNSLFTPSIS
jgi:hypothetical protein